MRQMYKTFSYICAEIEINIRMTLHSCLLCLGSNYYRTANMAYARRGLEKHFPNIRFGEEMETEAIGSRFLSPFSNQLAFFETPLSAEEVRTILKSIERENGRLPEDKMYGVVRIDIDLLKYDDCVLKPEDMEREFVRMGLEEFK